METVTLCDMIQPPHKLSLEYIVLLDIPIDDYNYHCSVSTCSLSLSLSLSLSGTLALCTRVDAFLSRQNEKNSSLEHSRYVCCAHKTHTRVDTFLSRYAINRMNRIEQSRTTVLEYYRGI